MRKKLHDGEDVQINQRPHSRILVWPIMVGLVLILLSSSALARLQPGPFSQWAGGFEPWREPAMVAVVVVGGLLVLLYPVRRVIRWTFTRYIVTTQRIIVRQGMVRRRWDVHYLSELHDAQPAQNWRQRMVGSGDIRMHLLPDGRPWRLREVPEVQRFNTTVQEVRSRAFRAVMQQTPGLGDYASEDDISMKGLRKLGRDH